LAGGACAGIVDEDVEAAAVPQRCLKQALPVVSVRDVRLDDFEGLAALANFVLELLQQIKRPRRRQHGGAAICCPFRKRSANALRGAGDENPQANKLPSSSHSRNEGVRKMTPTGNELVSVTSLPGNDIGKSTSAGAAKSGADCGPIDPDLARLVQLWPMLPGHVKDEVLALVERCREP